MIVCQNTNKHVTILKHQIDYQQFWVAFMNFLECWVKSTPVRWSTTLKNCTRPTWVNWKDR